MLSPEMIPEGQRYLSLLREKIHLSDAVDGKIRHSLRSLGVIIENNALNDLSPDDQKFMFEEGVLSRISLYGSEIVPYFVDVLKVEIDSEQIQEELDIHNSLEDHEYEMLNGIITKCSICPWEGGGRLRVSKMDNTILSNGKLIEMCMNHHTITRSSDQDAVSQHNIFNLFYHDDSCGHLAVSSAAVAGRIDIPLENFIKKVP